MSYQIVTTAATAIVGYDLTTGYPEVKNSSRWRILKSIAFVGSTNPADCAFELKVGNQLLGTFFNTTGGANKVPVDTDRKYLGKWIPPNSEIVAEMTDAAAANDVVVEFQFGKPAARRRTATRFVSRAPSTVTTYRRPYYGGRRY